MERDIKLGYDEAGRGAPPLVLVHGLLGDRKHWQPQFNHFAKTRRVVSLDLRGHGASARGTEELSMETLAADVVALLEELEISGAVLAGHSLGCRVVLEARLLAPDRTAGLVLVDGSNLGVDGKEPAQRSVEEAIAARGYQAFARGIYGDMFLEGHDPNLSGPIVERALAVPEQVCRSLFHHLIAYDADHGVAALRGFAKTPQSGEVPLLVIQSTVMGPDRVRRPLKQGEYSPFQELARANCPHAQLEVITGPGHFTQLEAPAAVNALLETFLARS